MAIDVGISALLSPMILFFILGGFAGLVRSDLNVPDAMGKAMSIYLMAAIGLKGGISVAEAGLSSQFAIALLAGVGLSLLLPQRLPRTMDR